MVLMRRVPVLLAIAVLAALPSTALAAACTGTDPAIEIIYAVMNQWEGKSLSADFGTDANGQPREPAMQQDGARWTLDLSTAVPLIPSTMPWSAVQQFKPKRVGWSFVGRANPAINTVTVAGAPRCAAAIVFDATAVWSVRVASVPESFVVKVSCAGDILCKRNSDTVFETKPAGMDDSVIMTVDLGLCTYPVTIGSHDMDKLPLKLTPRQLARGCTLYQSVQNALNPGRLRVPPDGLLITIVDKPQGQGR
jgi:hypothetical protein